VMAAPAATRPPPSRSTVPATPGTSATATTTATPPASPPTRDEPAATQRTEPAPAADDEARVPGVLVNRDELCALAGVTPADLSQLEEYGVVARRGGNSDLYGDDAVEIATAAGGFLRAGVDARHLRSFRTSAEREAGLYEQLILPALRQRNPQARSQAADRLRELDTLGARLRAAMTRSALRRHLEV
ncbi:MAG: hypothetical protein ACRDZ2_00470, partial [Ilumatobacteraceae bacterium]